MTPTSKSRLIASGLILTGVGVASTIAFNSLQQNLLYFQSPSEIAEVAMPPGRQFRLGGLGKPDRVYRAKDGISTPFMVADGPAEVGVQSLCTPPRLFPRTPPGYATSSHRPSQPE